MLPVGWAVLLLTAIWSLRASLAFSAGIAAANAGDWSTAARRLEQAVRRDPHHAYYHLEAGHAHGVLAQDQPDYLDEAIAHHRVAIARSPNYALNAAHLSVLLWQVGETNLKRLQIRIQSGCPCQLVDLIQRYAIGGLKRPRPDPAQ